MPKEEVKGNTIQVSVILKNAPKRAKDRKVIYEKVKVWVNKQKEDLHIEKIKAKKNRIFLSRGKSYFSLSFEDGITFNSIIENPKENIANANEIGNKIMNYLNTILGEKATGADILVWHSIVARKGSSLPRRLIKEEEVAKINELTKKIMNPIGVIFEYELDNRVATMFIMSTKEIGFYSVAVRYSIDDVVEWDFLKNEYKILNTEKTIEIITSEGV